MCRAGIKGDEPTMKGGGRLTDVPDGCAPATDELDSRCVFFRQAVATVVGRYWTEESNPLRHLRLDARTAAVAARDHDDRHGHSGLRHLGRALPLSHLADPLVWMRAAPPRSRRRSGVSRMQGSTTPFA